MWLSRRELERRQSYTDTLVDAILVRQSAAAGDTLARSQAVAAVETCAGLLSRGFSAGLVEPAPLMIGRRMMSDIGRDLVLFGESVWRVRRAGDGVTYDRAASWDEREDSYWCNFVRPSLTYAELVPAADLFHFRWGSIPARPWEGVSPVAFANLSFDLLSRVESSLLQEHSGSHGQLLPQPSPVNDKLQPLIDSIRGLAGRVGLVESSRSGWGTGNSPVRDWQTTRIGPQPVQSTVDLRDQVERSVFSALGVPLQLVRDAQGTVVREAWRIFLVSTVQPLANLAAEEIGEKMGLRDVTVEFGELRSSDLQARSRAFGSLVTGGMAPESAAKICGFEDASFQETAAGGENGRGADPGAGGSG